MNWVDVLIIVVVLVSALVGGFRGLLKEALTLVSWITALWVAWQFHPYLALHLSPWIDEPSLRVLAAVVTLFVLSLVLFTALSYLLTKLVDQVGLGGLNRSLGALFGLMRGVVAILLLTMLATLTPIIHEQWWQNSLLLPYFLVLAEWARQWLPSGITQGWVTTS